MSFDRLLPIPFHQNARFAVPLWRQFDRFGDEPLLLFDLLGEKSSLKLERAAAVQGKAGGDDGARQLDIEFVVSLLAG